MPGLPGTARRGEPILRGLWQRRPGDRGRLSALSFRRVAAALSLRPKGWSQPERREAQQQLERTRETLFRVQKMEAIGRLTGGVAHDFNNLLTAIIGSLELVRRQIDDDGRAATLLDNALNAAHRGATLTQRMLAFARGQELRPEPIDLPALVRGMTDLLERTLGTLVSVETRFRTRRSGTERSRRPQVLAQRSLPNA